ncbi:MAG TPA: DUF4440 domain-containing protein [Terriglobia bacterium]|nr:DUF4440 domain-containing protein [Terriglobia bacterium]
MLRYRSLFACIGLLALMTGCTTTPPDTRDADIKAVKGVEAAWVNDIATKDVDKFASYYSWDAVLLLPNAPIINGVENIKTALKPLLADPNFALTFQSTQAEASKGGDFVYTVGTYSMTVSNPIDKKPVTDKGKYLTVFKKQPDGGWKAVADMINSDMPAQSEHPQPKGHRAAPAHKHKRR